VKRTRQTYNVLQILAETPTEEWYGLELMDATKLKSGSLYPILARLEAHRIVRRRVEKGNPVTLGRPARIYYKITKAGQDLFMKWSAQQ